MGSKSFLLALVCLYSGSMCYADSPNKVGLGMSIGNPSGLTAKIWVNDVSAFNLQLAYAPHPNTAYFMADYTYHVRNGRFDNLKPYIGVGVQAAMVSYLYNGNQTQIGLRIPLGVEYLPSAKSVGFFWELAPGIYFNGPNQGFLQAQTGVRFYL